MRCAVQAMKALPEQTPVAVLTFAASISAYRLHGSQPLQADVLPGHCEPSPSILQRLSALSRCHLVSLAAARPALEIILETLRYDQLLA